MLELSIIKLFMQKEYYIKYNKLIYNNINNKILEKILLIIGLYYEEYKHHEYIAVDELQTFYLYNYPQDKNNEDVQALFNQLRSLEVSDSLAATIVNSFVEKAVAQKIVETLTPAIVNEKTNVVLQIPSIIEDYKAAISVVEEEHSPFLEADLEDLIELADHSAGLSWGIEAMDNNIGRLSGKSLGHIFARVETGKSSFISHSITSFAKQLKDKTDSSGNHEGFILWCGNEEDGRRFKFRTYQSMLNMTADEIIAISREEGGLERLKREYAALGGDHILFKYDPGLTVEDIVALLEKYPVRVLVVDIADHVHFRGDSEYNGPNRLEELYRRFRKMSVDYNCDVITVGQAAAEASGKRELHQEHMYNSKTGKPGALDYAVGIGATYNPSEEETRWLNFVKNKRGTTVEPIVPVQFDKLRGRFYG